MFPLYSNIDSSRWFQKCAHLIRDKVFGEKRMVKLASTPSCRTILQKFFVFVCNCCCFHTQKTYCDVLFTTY